MLFVNIIEKAPVIQVEIIDHRDGRRVPLQNRILHALIAAADGAGSIAEIAVLNACRRRGGFHMRHLRQIVRPLRLEFLAL